MKQCKKCKTEREFTQFYKHIHSNDGFNPWCKICQKEHHKSKAYKEIQKQYRSTAEFKKDEKIKKQIYNSDKEIKQRYNKNRKTRYALDCNFKLSLRLRTRLNMALKTGQKVGSAVRDLGCTIEEFKAHLESKFYPNPETGEMMTWDNWSRTGWHIDHKLPLSKFDLSERSQLLVVCNYINLQPLWCTDNWKKSDK